MGNWSVISFDYVTFRIFKSETRQWIHSSRLSQDSPHSTVHTNFQASYFKRRSLFRKPGGNSFWATFAFPLRKVVTDNVFETATRVKGWRLLKIESEEMLDKAVDGGLFFQRRVVEFFSGARQRTILRQGGGVLQGRWKMFSHQLYPLSSAINFPLWSSPRGIFQFCSLPHLTEQLSIQRAWPDFVYPR